MERERRRGGEHRSRLHPFLRVGLKNKARFVGERRGVFVSRSTACPESSVRRHVPEKSTDQ